ncbi:MAG: hypothetical protein ACT4P3_03310 [Betaproteobacteria bacterium]
MIRKRARSTNPKRPRVKRKAPRILARLERKPWMRYAGMVDSSDPQSSRKVDDEVYGKSD